MFGAVYTETLDVVRALLEATNERDPRRSLALRIEAGLRAMYQAHEREVDELAAHYDDPDAE